MTAEQKNLEKKVDQTEEKGFVKLQDIDKDLFKKLPDLKVLLKDQKTKSGFDRCFIEFRFHDLLKLTLPISLNRFNLLRIKLELPLKDSRGREKMDYIIPVKYRFVKGNTEYGEYKSVEIIFKQFVYETYFFQEYDQLEILKSLEESGQLKINWYVRPDKLSNEETLNYTWEK